MPISSATTARRPTAPAAFTIDVQAVRHANGGHDPSAEVRRHGQVLRCDDGQGAEGCRRRGADFARRRGGRREHVDGAKGPRPRHRRMGREQGREARLGGDSCRLSGGAPKQAPADMARNDGDVAAGFASAAKVLEATLRVPLSRPCCARAAQCRGPDEGRHAGGLGWSPDARSLSVCRLADRGRRRPTR